MSEITIDASSIKGDKEIKEWLRNWWYRVKQLKDTSCLTSGNESMTFNKELEHFVRLIKIKEAQFGAVMTLFPKGCGYEIKKGSGELSQFISYDNIPLSCRIYFLSRDIDVYAFGCNEPIVMATAIEEVWKLLKKD